MSTSSVAQTTSITGASLLLALLLTATLVSACAAPAEPAIAPRPTVIVVTANGPYFTSFDTAGGWLTGANGLSRGEIVEGQYVLTIDEPDQITWTHQQRAFGPGTYEVDATLISGPEASGFGLLLLGSSDVGAFMYTMITGDGRYDIGYCEQNCAVQESLIGGWTLSRAIQPGATVNHLRVDLEGTRLSLTVNGVLVSQINDISFQPGLVGLIGESAQYSGFSVAFDNLQVVESIYNETPDQ